MTQSTLIVGSIAFDTIHNFLGEHKVVGGSATYASIASSFFAETRLVGVVGRDFPREEVARLRDRGVDTEGIEWDERGDTFHWEGRYSEDLNSRETLKTELNVFADFDPKLPKRYADSPYVMLGNIAPALQSSVLDQLEAPKLVIADTMNFWIEGSLPALKALLKRVEILVINDEEARLLSQKDSLAEAKDVLLTMGPTQLVIKQGEAGAWIYGQGERSFFAPAFPVRAQDPTGAGDTFAGAFLGSIASRDATDWESVCHALVDGAAVASYCVEAVGSSKLWETSLQDVQARAAKLRA